MTNAHFCRHGCGARVIIPYGNWPELDRVPDHLGKIAAYQAVDGRWHARYLRPGENPRPAEKRYALHAPACPRAQAELPLDTRRRA